MTTKYSIDHHSYGHLVSHSIYDIALEEGIADAMQLCCSMNGQVLPIRMLEHRLSVRALDRQWIQGSSPCCQVPLTMVLLLSQLISQ